MNLAGENTSDDDDFVGDSRTLRRDLEDGRDGAGSELVADGLDTPLRCVGHCFSLSHAFGVVQCVFVTIEL